MALLNVWIWSSSAVLLIQSDLAAISVELATPAKSWNSSNTALKSNQ